MKQIFILLVISSLSFLNCENSTDPEPGKKDPPDTEKSTILIMSYNIRGSQPEDGINQWEYRKERVADLIKKYKPAIIGIQEAKPPQLEELKDQLENYESIGEGNQAGEYTVLLYDTDKVEPVEGSRNTLWLSETPEESSVGWDAKFPRILIYSTFKVIESGKSLVVFNTHFDHQGEKAREKSAELVVSMVQENENNLPAVLMGDFNFTEDSVPYVILTATSTGLKNAFYETQTQHTGPVTRSAGFAVNEHSDKKPIDFIFINDKIEVLKHAFLTDSKNGYYPSDHLPVLAEIELQ